MRQPASNRQYHDSLKLQPYAGTTNWTVFQVQLQIVRTTKGMSEAVAAQHLAAALRGPALELFRHLPATARENFQALFDALQRRFGTLGQVELHLVKFRSNHQVSGKSLQVLQQ